MFLLVYRKKQSKYIKNKYASGHRNNFPNSGRSTNSQTSYQTSRPQPMH